MEADSMHLAIERRLRNRDINLPANYVQYCKTARLNPRPYSVKYCSYSFLKKFEGIKFYNSINLDVNLVTRYRGEAVKIQS